MGTRWMMGAAPISPYIEFAQNRAGGNAGCNRWFAQATGDHPELRFVAIGSTRRICNETVMDEERAFLAALEATRRVRVEDNTLTLLGEDGAELAQFSRAR